MQPRVKPRLALVFGGSGTIGTELLRTLKREGIPAAFTYFRHEGKALATATELDQRAFKVDLSQPANVRELFKTLDSKGLVPDVLIYAAGVGCASKLAEVTDARWQELHAVNVHSAFVACQEFSARAKNGGDIVLLSALDRTQSLPLPIIFATMQGAIDMMAMALSKELGPMGIRVNALALGAMGEGLSAGLSPKLIEDYKTFSALRRTGRVTEAAEAALWLATENTYMTGKVFSANAGI